MTIAKVNTGDPVGKALKASTWNAFVDAANYHKLRHRGNTQSVFPEDENPATTVLIKNNSGAAVDYGAVLAISSPIITPTANVTEFKGRSAWNTTTPTASHHGKFLIAAEPIPAGKIGLAYCSGVVAVQVNVSHTWLNRCDCEDGVSDYLVAKPNGTAQILWREGGTGTQWAAVRLGALRDAVVVGKTAGNVTADSSGNVDIYVNGAATTYQIEVELDWMHGGEGISTGKEVMCTWFADEMIWRFTGAECE